jgi:hypothetical protein
VLTLRQNEIAALSRNLNARQKSFEQALGNAEKSVVNIVNQVINGLGFVEKHVSGLSVCSSNCPSLIYLTPIEELNIRSPKSNGGDFKDAKRGGG